VMYWPYKRTKYFTNRTLKWNKLSNKSKRWRKTWIRRYSKRTDETKCFNRYI